MLALYLSIIMKYILVLLFVTLSACTTTEIKNSSDIDAVVKLANNGNEEAMHNVCYRYRYGVNASENLTEALFWCSKAADVGISSAQTLLAEMYHNGLGTPVNYEKALYWYSKAAENNHVHAMLMLFYMYGKGEGVTPNAELAYTYLKKAADLGYDKAIEILKEIHEDSSIKV